MNDTHPSIEQIVDYLHGELSPADDAAMHLHFAECRSCEQRRSEEVALTELLRAHARAEERELPQGVAAAIYQQTQRRSNSPLVERLRAGLRPIYFVPAAVAAAVALYIGFGTRHSQPTMTAIDPAYYVQEHAAVAATAPFAEDAPPPTVLASTNEAR